MTKASRTVHLTGAAVRKYSAGDLPHADYHDKTRPGLSLRVSQKGRKTWKVFYRIGGKQVRRKIGAYPVMSLADARLEWARMTDMARGGIDPDAEKRTDTFKAVAEEWLMRDQSKNKTLREVRRVLDNDVLPYWADKPIADITRRDCIELIDRVTDRGSPIMARRLHSYLHRLFRWAVGRGIIDASAMTDLPRQGTEVSRDRVLDDGELLAVWKATDDIGWPFGDAVKLLILTGARRSEIGKLKWSEIGDDAIHLEGERTKNNKAHTIPLSAAALAVLAKLPRMAGSDFVFTTTGTSPVSGWDRAKKSLDGLVDMPGWRVHDLRRTLATGLQRLGVDLQTIEATLGHCGGSRSGIVAVYQRHSFDAEKRIALDRWGQHVSRLLTGAVGNVVPIRPAGA